MKRSTFRRGGQARSRFLKKSGSSTITLKLLQTMLQARFGLR